MKATLVTNVPEAANLSIPIGRFQISQAESPTMLLGGSIFRFKLRKLYRKRN